MLHGPIPSQFGCGGTFFFTVTLADRTSQALTDHIGHLRGAVRQTRRTQPFTIDAIVVLPDHLHVVMTLPDGDADYPNRWSLIKRRFTDAILHSSTARPRPRAFALRPERDPCRLRQRCVAPSHRRTRRVARCSPCR